MCAHRFAYAYAKNNRSTQWIFTQRNLLGIGRQNGRQNNNTICSKASFEKETKIPRHVQEMTTILTSSMMDQLQLAGPAHSFRK